MLQFRPIRHGFGGVCRHFVRNISSFPVPTISEEVRQAIHENKPVVALESTIITHGLPYPANLEMAVTVEKIIREHGAVPATIAFVQGVPKVGLTEEDLGVLGDEGSPRYKISRRDIPNIMSEKLTGGTTIAATMILAHKAGIDVFATGGLGGVSRPFDLMDVSADLDELSKTAVSVVCSGPKSILDVDRTMEYLETKGVPVYTYDDGLFPGGPQKSLNVPGFYTRDSGVPSPFVFRDLKHAARTIYEGKYSMKLENGYVFCIPAPPEVALPDKYIGEVIRKALYDAEKMNVRGKKLTPFMLERINQLTEGASVNSNIAFVKNNAVIGAQIAGELAKLKGVGIGEDVTPMPAYTEPVHRLKKATAAVIGSISLDSTSVISSPDLKMGDSNPGRSFHSAGGVGFNVALACAAKLPNEVLFISALNSDDTAGQSVGKIMDKYNVSREGLCSLPEERTSQYSSIHDSSGKLIVACADMGIIEKLPSQHVLETLAKYQPKTVLMDSNISVDLMNEVIAYGSQSDVKLLYEPTSAVKAFKLGKSNAHCFPDNEVALMTPTVSELGTIFASFSANGKFEDLDSWFAVLDCLSLDKLRDQLEVVARRIPLIKGYVEKGVFQQAFRLLPYVPSILIKDGSNGVIAVHLTGKVTELKGVVESSRLNLKVETDATFTVVQEGKHGLGVIVQHFPAYDVPEKDIKSVTGAGDSMVGYILSRIARSADFRLADLTNPERESIIMDAQKAACVSLASDSAVNYEELAKL